MKPLSELDPTTRFSDRVADYVRYRPSYPAAAIDAILSGLGDPFSLTAADVGAGTGISARLLADRGVHIIAVEPNVDMQQGAEPHARMTWRTGTAEATGLAANCVDLVLCAQAFHWFRQPEALAEFHRILKPGGRLALMWNQRDSRDPFTAAYRQAIVAAEGESPLESREYDPGVMDRGGLFTPAKLIEMPNGQTVDLAGLIGRATSASYVPKTGERFAQLHEALTRLHREYANAGGDVALRYVTQLYLATRIP